MTDFSAVPGAPRSDLPALVRLLADDLRAVDYTLDGVSRLLGAEANEALGRDQPVPATLALAGRSEPLAAVVRLWLLALPVPAEDIDAALPRVGVDGLRDLGLLEPGRTPSGGAQEAAVDLRPYGWTDGDGTDVQVWVASDLAAHQRPGVLRKDHVLGIGQASLTLAQATIRRPVGRALDVGTGCGIQAFHLLRHARTVVATDISERALAFTRFNLLLNAPDLGLSEDDFGQGAGARISLRSGSLLEPVAGEQFDLVVSNPPFVITPRHSGERPADQFTYRDGGLPGDAIVQAMVHDLPDVLAPGGVAQLLGNWEVHGPAGRVGGEPAGTDDGGTGHGGADDGGGEPAGTGHGGADDGGGRTWATGPALWVRPQTQAWFIQRELVGPAQYAETWLADASEGRDPEHFAGAYAEYLADFRSRSVTGVGFGYILLSRPDSASDARIEAAPVERYATAARFEEILYPLEQPLGPALAATLTRERWLDGRPDLHAERLVVAEDVTEERHQKPGAEHPGVILLRQGAGLRRTTLLSTELAGLVSACDGTLTVGQIVGALAALLERDDAEFADRLAAEVRNLVRDGFLLPYGD